MRVLKWMTAFALVFSAQMATVQAQGCGPCGPCPVSESCDFCDFDFCEVTYSAYADYLFWKTQKGDLNYNGDDDEEDHLCPDHDAGWRIAAFLHYRGWDLGVRWTSFFNKDSTTDADDDDVKFRFDFDVVDIEGGFTCCLCDSMTLRPFAGAKMAWIEDEYKKESEEETKIKFCAVGLYMGANARYELCSWDMCGCSVPMAIVARASTGILDAEFDQDVDTEGSDQVNECLYIPVHELYVGLDLSFCDIWCDMDAYMQIGYEVQYWGWREYSDNEDITHLGVGGLVVRLGTSF